MHQNQAAQVSFDLLLAAPRARKSDPYTSHEAAAECGGVAMSKCELVHALLQEYGMRGAEQIADLCDLPPYEVRKRLSDLENAKPALAEPVPGMDRLTRSGRKERIWRAK